MRENWVLLLLTLSGALLRFWGIGFGFPLLFFRNENLVVEPALRMAFGIVGFFKNPHLDFFDPQTFVYPGFYIYFLFFSTLIFQKILAVGNFLFPNFVPPVGNLLKTDFYTSARVATCLWGVVLIPLTYTLAKRILSKRGALLAALFIAFNPFLIFHSHFVSLDTIVTVFGVLTLICFMDILEFHSLRGYLLSGIFIGLAAATKYSPLFWLAILFFAHGMGILRRRESYRKIFCEQHLWAAIFAGLLSFALATPFTFVRFREFLDRFFLMQSWELGGVLTSVSTDPLYFIKVTLREKLTLPLEILALVGLCGGLFLLPRKRKISVLAIFSLATLAFFSRYPRKVDRWILSSFPPLLILAAWAWEEMVARFNSSERRKQAIFLAGAVLFSLLPLGESLLWDFRFSRQDTRILAKNWLEENVAEGSHLLLPFREAPPLDTSYYQITTLVQEYYNVEEAVRRDRAPNLETLVRDNCLEFLVVNSTIIDPYYRKGAREYYPETAASWISFFEKIKDELDLVAMFEPGGTFKDVHPGPSIWIYRVPAGYLEGCD